MTRLDEIRQQLEKTGLGHHLVYEGEVAVSEDSIRFLLAEIDRLKEELAQAWKVIGNAASRPIAGVEVTE